MHRECLLCGSSRVQPMAGYERDHLTRCLDCRFVFAARVPSEAELVECYGRYRRVDAISPITVRRYEELLDRFERYRATNRIIDLGCGVGGFLESARRRGWDVCGTEYSDEAIEICVSKGITMWRAPFEPTERETHAFDVVTAFEVLEHMHAPREEIRAMARLVRPQGALYLTTPNFDSLSRRLLGPRWNVIHYPEHLGYYTAGTLDSSLSPFGLVPVELRRTGVSPTRLRRSIRRVSDERGAEPPREGEERLRRALESSAASRLAKRAANAALDALGLGDSLKALFELQRAK
jgi:SAM-dependent methyltransferase